MGHYVITRALQGLATVFVVSVVVFLLARLTGDPLDVLMPEYATEEDYRAVRETLGLDKPLYSQYFFFVGNALHGDLGRSIKTRRPVVELIGQRLPSSAVLAGSSTLLAVLMGLALGVLAAVRKGTAVDTFARVIAAFGQSVPQFVSGIALILVFGAWLHLLPSFGQSSWKSFILPIITLGFSTVFAGNVRLCRSGMLEVLDSEFVKLARIKGLPERSVIWKHALRNAIIPVLTFTGFYFAMMVGGVVVTETVFAWPGVGRLAYEAVLWRDFPLIQGIVLILVCAVVAVNLVVDVLYAYIDPRIRYG